MQQDKPLSDRRRNEAVAERSTPHAEGVKETAESIIVAFILAFVFRAFIVEAFVIPTGSMASTLYGKHGAVVCEDCGWENVYGLTDTDDVKREARFTANSEVRCQNCGHVNTHLAINDRGGRSFNKQSTSNAESGDRILVFKWPFDFGGRALDPHRWDVTVFKNPSDPNENFIKRLIGLPSEVLEIIDGDVYSVPTKELSGTTLATLNSLVELKHELLNQTPIRPDSIARFQKPLPGALTEELAQKLRLRAKTPEAQQSLWLLVYNNDYPPRKLDENQPYWNALTPTRGDGWRNEDRKLVFGGGEGEVRFAGKPIVDHNAYNIDLRPGDWQPADLRLEAVLNPITVADGFVEFVLTKKNETFMARIAADGHVTLSHKGAGSNDARMLGEKLIAPLEPDQPIEIAFQNVDYKASLFIDGNEVLATTADQYAPNIHEIIKERPTVAKPPAIAASGIAFELLHVVLLRDVYYTSPSLRGSSVTTWAREGWGTTNHPILLREGEYFMLGDNSPASKDSRLWDVVGPHLTDRGDQFQLGTVPGDQLVGRAFFVYWPSGLRPGWVPYVGDMGLVPNVGKMRWIR